MELEYLFACPPPSQDVPYALNAATYQIITILWRHLPGQTEGDTPPPPKHQSGYSVFRSRFELVTSRIEVRSDTALVNLLGVVCSAEDWTFGAVSHCE
jgi:hypothetical protein